MFLTTSFYDMNQKVLTKKKEEKKRLFPKFQLIPILHLQVMHDYVHLHCSIDYHVKLILVDKNLCKLLLLFHTEMISA